jgi:radical SAM superfamily enzyme YgiQ (UPF0313 family)
MQVKLINLPSPFLYVDKEQIPLGLLYLGAVLKQNDIDVQLIDLAGKEVSDVTKMITNDTDIIAVSSTTPQFNMAKQLVMLTSGLTNCKYICGGPQPTIVPWQYLNNGYNAACIGEGEKTILSMVRDVEKKELKGTYMAEPIKNLDEIPLPAWDLIDMKSYKQTFLGKKIIHMMTSRGCIYKCAFCSHSVFQTSLRFRGTDNIMDEIYQLVQNYGYQRLMFMDDTFSLNPNMKEVMRKIKPLGVLWRCHFRSNNADKDLFETMYDSGCRHITLGIESGSQKILNNIHKGTTVEMNSRAVKLAHDAGLAVKAFTIVGLPGESMETMKATKQWLIDNRPDDFDLQIFHPYEDCDIYQHPEKYDIKFERDINYDDSWFKGNPKSSVSTSELTADQITYFRKEAFEELIKELRPVRL